MTIVSSKRRAEPSLRAILARTGRGLRARAGLLLVGTLAFSVLPAVIVLIVGLKVSGGAALNFLWQIAPLQVLAGALLSGWIALAFSADADPAAPRKSGWTLLRRLAPRIPAVMAAQAIATLGAALGLLFLLVPGLLLTVLLCLATQAAAVEGKGGLAALARSSGLGKGARLRLIAVLLLIGLLHLVVWGLLLAGLLVMAKGVYESIRMGAIAPFMLVLGLTPLTLLVTAPLTATLLAATYVELSLAQGDINPETLAAVFD